jgi:hypothetical protein
MLVERGQHLVERDVVASACAAAQLLIGGVEDDPVDPRSEGESSRNVPMFRMTLQKASCTASSASCLLDVMPMASRYARSP